MTNNLPPMVVRTLLGRCIGDEPGALICVICTADVSMQNSLAIGSAIVVRMGSRTKAQSLASLES